MAVFALVERLAHLIEKEVNLHLESKKEVENLTGKLKKVQEVLKDAERTGVTDSKVKNWLKELQDTSYEMDDALDQWQTANLQLQIEGSEEVSDPWEKVISFIQSICLCFKHVVGRREINLIIKGLIGKLDSIVQGKDEFGFLPSVGHNLQEFNRVESTSLVDPSNVHGRRIDTENLIQNLLSEGGSGVQIVSIVGTGGVGKTTLAQLAYNDRKVEEHFQLRKWISVSDPFDEIKIAKSVLKAVGESSSDILDLDMLLQRVKDSVSKKRFLIVLDDVWTEDRKRWEPLKISLQGLPGSRILVTTRSDRVVRVISTDTRQPLGQLSDDDCWSLLSGIAFQGRSAEECEKLEDVGRKIALNCKGLPLAAKTMGGLLRLKDNVGEWLNVLESPLWQLEAVMLRLAIPAGIPVSTQHDTGTGTEYGSDSSCFEWTRQEIFRQFVNLPQQQCVAGGICSEASQRAHCLEESARMRRSERVPRGICSKASQRAALAAHSDVLHLVFGVGGGSLA